MAKETKHSQSYTINDCQIDNVTIYQDRAEVTRIMKFQPTQVGEHEITINLLTMKAVNIDIFTYY